MSTLLPIIQMIYAIGLLAAPIWQHWITKTRKRGIRPYLLSVAFRPNARRLIEKLMVIVLLALPTIHMRTITSPLWVLPSIFIIILCFWHRVAERVLFLLNDNRRFFQTFLLMTLCLFVPHLYPVVLSLAMLMAAAMMYPPEDMVKAVRSTQFVSQVKELRSATQKAGHPLTTTQIITLIYERENH